MRKPIWSWFVFVFLFVFPTLIVGSGDITFPSYYSICVPGFACTVTWASTVNVGNIKLEVLRDDNIIYSDPIVATVTSSSTSKTLTWTPPASITMSDQYYYRATSLLNAALNGESGEFTIRPVDVWTNVDGSSVNMSSSFTVRIEAITIGTTSYSSNIKIAIYQDVLLTDPIILSTVTIPRTTTSYVWTVPENLSTTDINNCYVRITHTYGGTESSIDSVGRFNIIAPARTLTASLTSNVCVPGHPCTVTWSASAAAAVGGITVSLYHDIVGPDEFITTLTSANTGSSLSWTPLAGTYKTGESYYFYLSGNAINRETDRFELRGLQIKTPTAGTSYNLGDSFNVTWLSSPALANTLLPIRMFRSDNWALDAAFGVFYAYGRDGTIKLNIPRNMASTTAQYYAEITYTTDGTQHKQESPLFTVRGPTTSLYPSCSSCQCPSGGLLFADTCQCSIAQTCTPVVGGSTSSPTTTSISSVPADTCCRGSSACSGASATQTINSVMFCCPQGGSMTNYNSDCNCGGRAQLCNGPLPTEAPTTAPVPQATATPTATPSPIGTNGASNGNSNGGNINNNISQSSSSSSTLPIAIGAAVGGLVLLAAIIGGIWWRSRRANKVFVTEAGPQKIQTMPRQSIQPIQVPPHYQKQIDDSMAKSPV